MKKRIFFDDKNKKQIKPFKKVSQIILKNCVQNSLIDFFEKQKKEKNRIVRNR